MFLYRVFPRQTALQVGIIAGLGLAAASNAAVAQDADINLRARIDSVAPDLSPLAAQKADSPTERGRTFAATLVYDKEGKAKPAGASVDTCVTPHQYAINRMREQMARRKAPRPGDVTLTIDAGDQEAKRIYQLLLNNPSWGIEELNREIVRTYGVLRPRGFPGGAGLTTMLPGIKCGGWQETKASVKIPFNASYETNILKSDKTWEAGTTTGFGGIAEVTMAGYRRFDIMYFGIGTGSGRYQQYPTRNIDVASAAAAYQVFLGGFTYLGGEAADISDPKVLDRVASANVVTFNTLTFGIQNTTSFTELYRRETADVLTPQVALAWQNISLLGADPTNVCKKDKPTEARYCLFADVVLTMGESFSEQSAQQTANFGAQLKIGRRFDSGWTLAGSGSVNERVYLDYAGGRTDVIWSVGSTLAAPALPVNIPGLDKASLGFNMPITYTASISSLQGASWHGLTIVPSLTFSFNPK